MTSEDAETILAQLEKLKARLTHTSALMQSTREDLAIMSSDMKTIREDMATVREHIEAMKALPAEERPLNPLGVIKKDPWIRHWETLCARRASSR